MQNPSKFNKVLIVSLTIPSLIYIVFGFMGVLYFESSGINPLILANIPKESLFYIISAIGLALVCFLSYPIALYPALLACEASIKESESKVIVTNWKRILIRLGIVLLTCTIAYFIENFQIVVSFNILIKV